MHIGLVQPAATPSLLVDLPPLLVILMPVTLVTAGEINITLPWPENLPYKGKKKQLRAFHLERKRVKRTDLKANSHAVFALGESFSHAPMEEVLGANVSQCLHTPNTAK